MKTTKLFTILRTFSDEEMKRFEKFIISPYNNPGKNVKPLFKALKKYHPEYPNVKLTEDKIHKLLYRADKTKEKKAYIKVLLSNLTNLAVEFMKSINNENEFERKFSEVRFLKMLNTRKLDSIYSGQYNAIKKSLPKVLDPDSGQLLLKMQLEKENCNFLLDREEQQKTSEVLMNQGEYLLLFFLSEIFKIRAHYKTNEYVFNANYEGTLLNIVMDNFNFEPIVDFIKSNSPGNYPTIAIYYNSMMAQLDINNDNFYRNFRDLLEDNVNLFDSEELMNLYTDLEGCCWKRLNNSIDEEKREYFSKEIFELYKRELSMGLHKYEQGYMRIFKFRNIHMAALNLKEYDWLEDFTKRYYKELAPEYRENMYNYSLAVVSFNRGNYENSLKLFSNIKYDYFNLKVDTKNWMLLIYYELSLMEQAYSLIDTYKHFLAKNKNLSAIFRKNNLDFLNYYVKLIKFKDNRDVVDLEHMKNEISARGKLIHKGWLLKKIEELKSLKSI